MKNYLMYPSFNGIMGITKNNNVSVSVKNTGQIDINVIKSKKKLNILNKFMLRGLVFLFFGLYSTFYNIFGFSSREESKNIKKITNSLNISSKNVIVFIMLILTMLLSFFVFGFLPLKLSYVLSPNFNVLVKRLIIAFIKISLIYLTFLLIKFIPYMKNYYMFNTALKLKQKEFNTLNFLEYFICSVLLSNIVLSILGLSINYWYSIFVNLFITAVVFSFNYELLLQIQNIKWLNCIFLPIFYLFYEKPSHLELKCVNILTNELELSNSKRDNMQEGKTNEEKISFSEAYVLTKEILEKAGKFEKSDLDYIFAEVLNKSRAEVKLIKYISRSDFNKIKKFVVRRSNGEPLTKMFGYASFYGLDFIVNKDVLSPRMDTERLVEEVLKNLTPKQNVLDIGTGSGAIAIAIAKNSKAKVTALDISISALEIAKRNAKKNNVKVKFIKSNLFDSLSKFAKFDVIVSNPPYIPTKDINSLDDEVKNYDPIIALDGGENGLDFYVKIIEQAPKKLKKNGKIYFEVGIGQALSIKKLLQKNFKDIRIVKDYNKIARVVVATLN